jgi:uncharacterized protein YpbB
MHNISSTWLIWCQEYKKASYTPMVAKTHKLFLELKTISKVAKERGVNSETVERQLIQVIVKGLLSIDLCVSKKNQNEILLILEKSNPIKLGDIKKNISKKITWFEIKAVIASLGIEA